MLRIIINGANGRMGQEAVNAINNQSDMQLVAELGRQDDLAKVIKTSAAQVVVDLTTAAVVYENAIKIIDANAHPVIGTSGLTFEQIHDLQTRCKQKHLGGIIAPNFSIGAVLMMKYAQDAARYLPDVEIIEMHHDQKVDAPSGTAMKTANMIAENRARIPEQKTEHEIISGSRGGQVDNVSVHSVRLPGLVAHQIVVFGGECETLTIRHDSLHRKSFMPGIILACKKVVDLKELVYGLDNVL